MNNVIKKNIKILSDKYKYNIIYIKDILVLNNLEDKIEIKPSNKESLTVSYELNNGSFEIKIPSEFIFDILFSLFERQNKQQIKQNNILITLEVFYNVEGSKEIWEEIFNKATHEEETKGIFQRKIGGNRILVEY